MCLVGLHAEDEWLAHVLVTPPDQSRAPGVLDVVKVLGLVVGVLQPLVGPLAIGGHQVLLSCRVFSFVFSFLVLDIFWILSNSRFWVS